MSPEGPQFEDVLAAHKRIGARIHRTPILKSELINSMTGAEVFFKCENFQKVGAFKFRGAVNAVLSLSDSNATKGVATHSSGNHAAALALAAGQRGIDSYIVMPENSPEIKKNAVKGYGAKITFCKPTLKAREETLLEVVKRTGATFIHPYNNFNVISGQGTAALEMHEDVANLDAIFAPVGGGGLLSGTAIATKGISGKIKVYGVEPKGADDAYRSFKSRKLIPSENPKTIADGLLTSLGSLTFPLIMENVDDIFTVSEQSIIFALRTIWERMKIVIEPSAAVPPALLLSNRIDVKGKRIGVILSGGNIDLGNLPF